MGRKEKVNNSCMGLEFRLASRVNFNGDYFIRGLKSLKRERIKTSL